MSWLPDSVTRAQGGYFRILFTPVGDQAHVKTKPYHTTDVTFFRNTPSKLLSFSSSDPFGDSTAQIQFPQLTPYDDLSPDSDVGFWLGDFATVDIYWVPVAQVLPGNTAQTNLINPLTDQRDLYELPKEKIWEGFVANIDIGEPGEGWTVSCQGALFQLDCYLAKPMYPPRPWPIEKLIQYYFNPVYFPHLRTKPVKIEWPTGWTRVAPAVTPVTQYSLEGIKKGEKYTGYSTRSTGSWDRVLTGFVADQLAVMWVLEDSGVTPGNQWTLLKHTNRQPYLTVRDRFKTPDFEIWYGTPGVKVRLTRDTTQTSNVIYGEGTGTDGNQWSNAQVINNGSRTEYQPLAALAQVYPAVNNPAFDTLRWTKETLYKFGSGYGMDQAMDSAEKSLARDSSPGWSGDLELMIDPSVDLTRWQITAGMTVKIKGVVGSGSEGVNFHIASVDVNVSEGRVSMKIDTRYRDLLNLEEALARTRDPLTPAKMLQVGRKSVMIDDIMAPWNYSAGSGFVPQKSVGFHKSRDVNDLFPWIQQAKKYPPGKNADYYVRVNANSAKSYKRWSFLVPNGAGGVLLSQKGQIRRTEIACFDADGNLKKIRFHVSIYTSVALSVQDMPNEGTNYDPFTQGFFEKINDNGLEKGPDEHTRPNPEMIIGWGNHDQPAGYSPGRFSDGAQATGLLVDEAPWTYDMLKNPNFKLTPSLGTKQPANALMVSMAFYAQADEDVYFMGRFFRAEPGS